MNFTCTLNPFRFGATSDSKRTIGQFGGNGSTQRSASVRLTLASEQTSTCQFPSTNIFRVNNQRWMIGLGLYKFGCQAVPVSNRRLYLGQKSGTVNTVATVACPTPLSTSMIGSQHYSDTMSWHFCKLGYGHHVNSKYMYISVYIKVYIAGLTDLSTRLLYGQSKCAYIIIIMTQISIPKK